MTKLEEVEKEIEYTQTLLDGFKAEANKAWAEYDRIATLEEGTKLKLRQLYKVYNTLKD